MKIREVIEKIVEEKMVMAVQLGRVTELFEDHCTVTADYDDREFFEVPFNALLENGEERLVIRPEIDSKVAIGVLPNAQDAILLHISSAAGIVYRKGTMIAELDEKGLLLQRNDEDLKTVLGDYIDEVNKIVVVNGTTIDRVETLAIKARLNMILR
ncbi:hypothetical protein [Spongiimicrobium salis]|uniref:hypothetical protein n=1 Tax=Spongiimicrobium salis TaxID=1667022 RepID=UPI00374CF42F